LGKDGLAPNYFQPIEGPFTRATKEVRFSSRT
jgi:hypothetical protein